MSSDYRWIGAACDPSVAGGVTAHLDTALLSVVDESGLAADMVCTHIDRSAAIAAVTVSARVPGETSPASLAALGAGLGGTAIVLDSTEEPVGGAYFAAEARAGTDGRCVRFPGQGALTGLHSVAEIVATSAIDDVVAIGTTATPDMVVDTRAFLRPVFQDGHLTLLVEPAAGGLLRPVEIEQPHECCGGH